MHRGVAKMPAERQDMLQEGPKLYPTMTPLSKITQTSGLGGLNVVPTHLKKEKKKRKVHKSICRWRPKEWKYFIHNSSLSRALPSNESNEYITLFLCLFFLPHGKCEDKQKQSKLQNALTYSQSLQFYHLWITSPRWKGNLRWQVCSRGCNTKQA